jgi:hypothetical protein
LTIRFSSLHASSVGYYPSAIEVPVAVSDRILDHPNKKGQRADAEVVPRLVEVEVMVPRLTPAVW